MAEITLSFKTVFSSEKHPASLKTLERVQTLWGRFASQRQTEPQKQQIPKSGRIWSQELLRWGDSTSPHRIFTLLILWHIVISCSPTSLVNFHFWWMAEVVCELQDFFVRLLASPPPPPPPLTPPIPRPWVGVNETFYVLPRRRLRCMLDMSRFVRN